MIEAAVLAFPQRPDDRLRLALHRLEEALAEQGQAVSAWRRSLAELAEATGRLQGSMGTYRGEVDAVAEAVRHADAEARRLERAANALLQAGTSPPG